MTTVISLKKNWSIHLLFTIVVLYSVAFIDTTNSNENYNPLTRNKSLGLAFSIIILVINLAVLGLHFLPIDNPLTGSKIEAGIPLVVAVFWIVMVCMVTGPRDGLAIDIYGDIHLGNLYYFTWAGLFTSIYILASGIQDLLEVNIMNEMRDRSDSLIYWALLFGTSLVVMIVSSDIYNRSCSDDNKNKAFCGLTTLGIAVGVIGTLFSLLIVVLKMKVGAAPFLLETSLASLLLLLFLIEVIFLTDDGGPGAPLGNLYYFSWASLFLTVFVVKACVDNFQAAQAAMSEVQPSAAPRPSLSSNFSEGSDDTPGTKKYCTSSCYKP